MVRWVCSLMVYWGTTQVEVMRSDERIINLLIRSNQIKNRCFLAEEEVQTRVANWTMNEKKKDLAAFEQVFVK